MDVGCHRDPSSSGGEGNKFLGRIMMPHWIPLVIGFNDWFIGGPLQSSNPSLVSLVTQCWLIAWCLQFPCYANFQRKSCTAGERDQPGMIFQTRWVTEEEEKSRMSLGGCGMWQIWTLKYRSPTLVQPMNSFQWAYLIIWLWKNRKTAKPSNLRSALTIPSRIPLGWSHIDRTF